MIQAATISVGDHVRVNDGRPYLALVLARDGTRLIVRPLIEGRRRLPPKRAKVSWVDAHWKLQVP